MADIVERLQSRQLPDETEYQRDARIDLRFLLNEAANEIKRLREKNEALRNGIRLAAIWTVEPGTTIPQIRVALGESK